MELFPGFTFVPIPIPLTLFPKVSTPVIPTLLLKYAVPPKYDVPPTYKLLKYSLLLLSHVTSFVLLL